MLRRVCRAEYMRVCVGGARPIGPTNGTPGGSSSPWMAESFQHRLQDPHTVVHFGKTSRLSSRLSHRATPCARVCRSSGEYVFVL